MLYDLNSTNLSKMKLENDDNNNFKVCDSLYLVDDVQ